MNKRAIVLGGGGARGPYQIGVWKALRELSIEYSIVTGTSVGALNGALMVQGDYDKARDMWLKLTLDQVVSNPPKLDGANPQEILSYMRSTIGSGGLDTSPLESAVREIVDEEKIRNSPIQYGLVTTEFPLLRAVQLTKDEVPAGEMINYMLASAAWFPFFRTRNIDGKEYIDGAYSDNIPAQLAVRCGAEEIIAVDMQGTGIVHSFRHKIPVRYIRCHWNLGDMMEFGQQSAQRTMMLGYHDALRAYHRVEGRAYTFYTGDTAKNTRRLLHPVSRIYKRTGVNLLAHRHRLIRLQSLLRYRSMDSRFMHTNHSDCTLGCAITTAAEITGEFLQVPPESKYHLRQFNKQLLRRAGQLFSYHHNINRQESEENPFTADKIGFRSRHVLVQIYDDLRDGCIYGRVPKIAKRLSSLFPVEAIAANYLLALELYYRRKLTI